MKHDLETLRSKKILFIAPSPLYVEKGSSLRMYAILEILSRYYTIDLVTYSTGKEFKLDNVTVHRTPSFFKPSLAIGKPSFEKMILDFFMYIKIIRLSLFKKYDVIHCEDFEGIALGYFSAWLNRKSHYVYDLHNRILDNLHLKSKPKKFRDKIILFLEKCFVKKSDKVILNWYKYKNDLLLSTRPNFLYYDPIDTSLADIEIPKEKYLIYSGNFEEYQGLSDFIPVFASSSVSYKLYLIGNPTKEIVDLVDRLDCKNRIVLLGRRTVQETNSYIKGATYGVLPRREGSCMKAIHYLLWSKPVIAKDTPSNREMVVHEHNGFLYKNNNELAMILLEIEDNSYFTDKLRSGVEETRDKILSVWSVENFINKYEN